MICRTGFAGRASKEDYPLSNRFDEIDSLVIFDNVLIPWENVLFYRHTKAACFYPSDASSLFSVRICTAYLEVRRHDDWCSTFQCTPDRLG
jgi:aromatic ring hydroxylase